MKLTKIKVKKAIPGSKGIISLIAKRCDVNWHTVKKFIEAEGNEKIKLLYLEELEKILDLGETRLYDAVDRCEPWAVGLLLKTIGRKRGYIEKQEIINTNYSLSAEEKTEKLKRIMDKLKDGS